MAEQTTQALLGLILALIIILTLYPSCQRFFETNRAEGYNDLINAMDEVSSGKTLKKLVDVRVKEDSFIAGFTKKSPYLLIRTDMTNEKWAAIVGGVLSMNPLLSFVGIVSKDTDDIILERPSICPMDKSCICFCKNTEKELDDYHPGESIKCKGDLFSCESYDTDFPSVMKASQFYHPSYEDQIDEFPVFLNGFILFKKLYGEELMQPLPVWITRVIDGRIFVTMNPYTPPKEMIGNKPNVSSSKGSQSTTSVTSTTSST